MSRNEVVIFHDFPDLQWLKLQSERNFADRQGWHGRVLPSQGWPNVVLNVKTQNIYRDHIRGPLSIFTNILGESLVEADNRRVRIREGYFYVTNADQRYTLEVEGNQTETFNIHFGTFFTEQVFSSLNKDASLLLGEGPSFMLPESICFQNRLHVKEEAFQRIILEIKNIREDPLLLEEKLYALMILLLKEEKHIRNIAGSLPVIKNSTRKEIVKRLLLATDFIFTYYDKELSLDELARNCCLSKFHFLRLFKIAFGTTPHHYINSVRIQRAKELLRNSKLDIHTIARHVGFKDASSFSRMFYTRVGVYPSQFH